MGDERQQDFNSYRRRELGLEHVGTRVAALQRSLEPVRKQQAEQIERVSHRIAGAILAFFRARDGQEFHADDLRRHVAAQCGQLAPGSADRIMRDMRRRGVIAYELVDRASSLYRAGRG